MDMYMEFVKYAVKNYIKTKSLKPPLNTYNNLKQKT